VNQRLCQAHFYFCENQVKNFKHLVSKKEKELVIFQRTHTLKESITLNHGALATHNSMLAIAAGSMQICKFGFLL
jgi:hypothetical protein